MATFRDGFSYEAPWIEDETFREENDICSSSPTDSWQVSTDLLNWGEQVKIGREKWAMRQLWNDVSTLFRANKPHPEYIIPQVVKNLVGARVTKETPHDAEQAFGITPHEALLTRLAHQKLLKSLSEITYPPFQPFFLGKGIVILAGGSYLQYAATALNALRELGSDLPVEIWGIDDNEEDTNWSKELKERGAVFRKVSDYAPTKSWSDWINPLAWLKFSAFDKKVIAILFSSFEEVIFLDADNIPARDPAFLFETQEYKETGAIIWPDWWQLIGSTWLPYLIGLAEGKSETLWRQQSAESGQFVWDKRRHWQSLLLACYYNYYGQNFWYTAITGRGPGWGDKDTYRIALQATEEPYHMIPGFPEALTVSNTSDNLLLMQFSPSSPTPSPAANNEEHPLSPASQGANPIPAFLHSCGKFKWSLPGVWNAFLSKNVLNYRKYLTTSKPMNSQAQELLRAGKRIVSLDLLQEKWPGWDPEILLWRSVEYTACYSRALGSSKTCAWVRDHMVRVFGEETRRKGNIHACFDKVVT